MSEYDRSVSATSRALNPESVWELHLPEIRFGSGAVEELGHQLSVVGVDEGTCGLLVTDETLDELGHVDRARAALEEAGVDVDVYTGSGREPSVRSVEACVEFAREQRPEGYDFFVGLGGGSCQDTVKAARVVLANGGEPRDYLAEPTGGGEPVERSGPPLVLVPTTAGTGAEVSSVTILSVKEENVKEGISNRHVQADAAVLDPTLTTTLPPDITAESAMDALAGALEGYTTHRYDELLRSDSPAERPVYSGRTPVGEQFLETAIELLGGTVRQAVNNGDDLRARERMLRGTLFGAIAGLTSGASLCHAMSYPVSNRYGTYHGETVAVLTPASTLGYNAASDPERYARLAELLGADTTAKSAREAASAAREEYVTLQRDLNVLPSGLAELAGIGEEDVDWLAERTVETQERLLRANPRPVTDDDVCDVYLDALHNWEE
jgi:alcohol dehydrogenase class IV